MEFTQSAAYGIVTKRFAFGPDKLEHAMTNGRVGKGFSIAYEAIPIDSQSFVAGSRQLAVYGVMLWAAGNAAVFAALKAAGPPGAAASVLLALAGSALVALLVRALLRRGRVEGTTFKTSLGAIEVIKDARHDEILREIAERRKARVRAKLAAVDPANPPAMELRKFRWLKDSGFITPPEFDRALAEIESLRQSAPGGAAAPPPPKPEPLN